jgi:phospholipid N-methyltransferase
MAPASPLKFLAHGIKNAATVGAVWPSSRGLARAMVAPVFAEHKGPVRVLEVGAGVGPVTAELVSRLQPGDSLDVVELNPDFCRVLRERFVGAVVEPRIHEMSVLDFGHGLTFHHVISGLPLASFPAAMVERIYARLFDLLGAGGTLTMFEHIGGRQLLRNVAPKRTRAEARKLLEIEERLEPFIESRKDVVLNVPPARVLVRRKGG